jgi:hypothetical protein
MEDSSRQENPSLYGKVLAAVCFSQTLADKLYFPFSYVAVNPFISFLVLAVIYIVFLIIFSPLYLLSYIITSIGSCILFLLCFHYLIIYIIRLIAFPGCSISSQKSLSNDFLKRLLTFLENIAISSNQYFSTLMLIANGQLPVQEIYTKMKDLHKILLTIEYLPNVVLYLKDTLDYLKKEKLLTSNELKTVNDFILSLETYYSSFHYLYHFINEEYYSISSHSSILLSNSTITTAENYHVKQKNNRLLLSHASKCLKASENMRLSSLSLNPNRSGSSSASSSSSSSDEENEGMDTSAGLNELYKLVFSFRESISSYEHITFPYMRSILKYKYGAKYYLIKGKNENIIDCCYINYENAVKIRTQQPKKPSMNPTSGTSAGPVVPTLSNSAKQQQQQKQAALSVEVPSDLGDETSVSSPCPPSHTIVLFCNPNAAFYETISQQEYEKSWLGFYMNLGYDVFFYNYRGYGRSTSSPSPIPLKEDGKAIVSFIRKEFPKIKLIIHGESIGGMTACSIAADPSNKISALVCDRTFASLDATASRLMGNWAGNFMKYGAFWSTNVVNDYLNVTCPKLVLQVRIFGLLICFEILFDSSWFRLSFFPFHSISFFAFLLWLFFVISPRFARILKMKSSLNQLH